MIVALYLAITSAWAGGSLYGHQWFSKATWVPEALFAAAVAVCAWHIWGVWWVMLIAAPWTYAFFQSATGPLLPWDEEGFRNPDKDYTLRVISDPIADMFNVEFDSEAYAWIYAAVKGFLITLPVGGLGVITWPLAYELSSHSKGRLHTNPTLIQELMAGVATYLAMVPFL